MASAYHSRIALLLTMAGALTLAPSCSFVAQTSSGGGPIILISIDTLRADHLPLYGYRHVETPAIDRLAADGVVFERAYSHVPQTLPAHTSMLSGKLPFEHGVRDNVGFTVSPDVRLLPEWLHERGFDTAAVVSADVLRHDTGIGRGFDFFDGEMPAVSGDVSSDRVRRDGSASAAIAERWIGARTSPRFFLFLHLYEPHAPYAPPAQFGRYLPYDGEIAYADDIVGQFLTFLRSHRLYDPATIVLVSDHGEGLGDHGEQEHGLFVYEETVRVPLVIKLPGQRMGGHRVAQPVQHIDLVPTILDLVGMSVPPDLHGRSLRPVLERKELRASLIYSESLYGRYHFGWSELMALTEDRYRFIHAPREELYDLATDRTERHNVAAARPQTTAAMRAALASIAQTARVNRPAAPDTEQLKRLAALGYVTTQVDLPPEASGAALPDPKDKIAVLQNYRRVVDFAQEGRLAAAIDLLRSILKDEPTMADLWLQLATLQRRVGNTSQSIEAYQRVLRLRPHNTSAALALASAFLALGRFDEAAAAAQTALTDASHESRDLAAGHELLARIALARDDAATARREAAAAVSADGSLPLPQFVEGRLAYSAGDFPRAIAAFDGALRRSTTLTRQVAELHLFAGDTLAHLGRFDDAEHQFEEEIRFFPANIWAYASLANLYHAEGRTAECTRALDAMLRAVPSPEAFSLATRLLTEFGEAERAAQTRAAARRQFAGSQSR